MKTSGLISTVLLLVVSGCWYGFAGGGLPSNIETIAVLPFENATPAPELAREVYEALRGPIESRLGLRSASEERADAVVRGTILRYDTDVPVGFSADPDQATTARRKLQLSLDIEIIDQTSGRTLWSQRNLTVDAEYAERAERDGLERALERLVEAVIDGAQSQW
ncbi:MAG: LPS assembly lipoprotein LptE [Gemmatimonadaceae bacterium]